jgi:hypothetical protein
MNRKNDVTKYEVHASSNKYLDLINDFSLDDDEYAKYKKEHTNKDDEDYYGQKEEKISADQIYRLPDDKIYDYLDFQHSIKNWNDFLQPRF